MRDGVTHGIRRASASVHCLVLNSRGPARPADPPKCAAPGWPIVRVAVATALGVAALAAQAGVATAQQAELAGASSRVTDMREMAMFHNSTTFVWIRATDAGTVLVYASVDFRNAFAQPVELTAAEADVWAAVAEPLTADSLRVMASRRERPDTTATRSDLGQGEFVLLSRPGTDPPSLTMKIGALRPTAVTTMFVASTLGSLAQAVREAARAAREMAANRAADSTARAASLAAASMPAQQVAPQAPQQVPLAAAVPGPAPADSSTPAQIPVVPAADPSAYASLATPGAAAPSANLVQRLLPAPAKVRIKAYAASSLSAPPSARTTAVNVRSAPQPTTVAIVATTTPVIPPAPAAPAMAAPAPAAAPVTPAAAVPALVAAAPAPASPPARTLSDSGALSDGGLSDDEFTTEVHRRESSMTACYAQYGLSANPALRGRVTVRISLSDSGEVMRATVVDRSWTAAVPTEVESCIVHRVFVWHFPVARRSSIHDYTVIFGH
jgi:hypothetical protein